MTTLKPIAVVIVALSLAGLVASSVLMARRLGQRDNHLVWFSDAIVKPGFEFEGNSLEFVENTPPEDAPTRPRTLEIRYRGEAHAIPIEPSMRVDDRLPGLLKYDDWLRVHFFAEGAKTEHDLAGAIARKEIAPRLVISVRRVPDGFDPATWGSVRRREWRYTFIEPQPAGSAGDPKPLRVIEATYGDLDKLASPSFRRAEGREADYWQFAAMEKVTPPTLFRSRNRQMDEAMQSMGWTWPVAGICILGVIGGTLLLALGGGHGRPSGARPSV